MELAERFEDMSQRGRLQIIQHDTDDFVQLIEDYASLVVSGNPPANPRKRLIQVAALAVAAVESIDRKLASNNTPDKTKP